MAIVDCRSGESDLSAFRCDLCWLDFRGREVTVFLLSQRLMQLGIAFVGALNGSGLGLLGRT